MISPSQSSAWVPAWLCGRAGAYVLLVAATAVLYLPALGAPSLWDVDESHNSDCTREMLESGNWVIPTFNYKLRVDKPVLLYWLQIGAFSAFGVNEFGARLPSALAAMLTVLLTYELARRMFGQWPWCCRRRS
jgi:4-amino-4-deoxy-L-arabinose transferase-like glycosyltransferase